MKEQAQNSEIHTQFQIWEKEFEQMQAALKETARALGAEKSISAGLDSLHAQMKEAWDQLDRHHISGRAWADFRNAFEEAWQNLKSAVENVVSRQRPS